MYQLLLSLVASFNLNPQLSCDTLIFSSQFKDNIHGIAQKITVRVLTDLGSGSGFIVKRDNNDYTILTNQHVVDDTRNSRYMLTTYDNIKHLGSVINTNRFNNIDLALIKFTTKKSYSVAQVRNTPLVLNENTYAIGFPNWYWQNNKTPFSTKELTFDQAFRCTAGSLNMTLNKPLFKGYQIGYTNNVENGMSGGPILDQTGKVIGINGRLKESFFGITTFLFADGSLPSRDMFNQMNKLSWGIPISTFLNSN